MSLSTGVFAPSLVIGSGIGLAFGMFLHILPLNDIADELIQNKGKSIIISDSNNKSVQLLVNLINNLLDNYGNTIDINKSYNIRKGDDKQFGQLINDLSNNNVSSLIFLNCNPVYDNFKFSQIKENLDNVSLKISTSDRIDETSVKCDIVQLLEHQLQLLLDLLRIQ